MANQEHVKVLKRGTAAWNKWREKNPDIQPDLSQAILNRAKLTRVDLSESNLNTTSLRKAILRGSDFGAADLRNANLKGADFSPATPQLGIHIPSNLYKADLRGANLVGVDFSRTNLEGANLQMAHIWEANFGAANLKGANLRGADLTTSKLLDTNLEGANLIGANLTGVEFGHAILKSANLSESRMRWATFLDVDLSEAVGLDLMVHQGPSYISIDTIYLSKGNIPDTFLRGAGIPDNFITYMHSLVGKPLELFSCFISYSTRDNSFAQRLYADLQSNNVRCWFAPEDLRIGDKTRIAIDESIRKYDKLLLILSIYSVQSEWVEKEVETAMERERKEKRIVLFPIMLDDEVMKIESGWPADIRRTRNIGDFRRWKNHDFYKKALNRLLGSLKSNRCAEDST